MVEKNMDELNLLNNYLFGFMVTYPGIGEPFCKKILGIIFNRSFRRLKVIAQKTFFGANPGARGAVLDVFIEGDEATVYDIEPDNNSGKEAILALPKRMRFYHAKIDTVSLKAGQSYRYLKNVVTIVISPYDPFGYDRMVYTIKNGCIEEPDIPYEDGACTIYLYTRGSKGNPSKPLRELLQFMESPTPENAVNKDLLDIQRMVDTVRKDAEVSLEYMRLMEEEEILLERGIERGKAEGKAESIIELLEDYAPLDESLKKRIYQEQDLSKLTIWHKLAARVASVEEFIAKM